MFLKLDFYHKPHLLLPLPTGAACFKPGLFDLREENFWVPPRVIRRHVFFLDANLLCELKTILQPAPLSTQPSTLR